MRKRFEPPTGDMTDPNFVRLVIRAGSTDVNDREPSEGDYAYWGDPNFVIGMQERSAQLNMPDYYWRKLIGWQAQGPDIPKYGPYAVPRNDGPVAGWSTPFVDVDSPPPPPDPKEPQQSTLDAIATVQETVDLARQEQRDNQAENRAAQKENRDAFNEAAKYVKDHLP